MTQGPAEPPPSPLAPAGSPDAGALVLPRPNLGPVPWSEPAPPWTPIGLAGAGMLAAAGAALVLRRWLRTRHLRRNLAEHDPALDGPEADAPDRRLIASSRAVRAALIAAFGPTWGSRTTEEVARDPDLAARLGPAAAGALVDYLRRVDHAKFAGDEAEDADHWIAAARAILAELARRPPPRRAG